MQISNFSEHMLLFGNHTVDEFFRQSGIDQFTGVKKVEGLKCCRTSPDNTPVILEGFQFLDELPLAREKLVHRGIK